jgi:hypothetical protein
MELEKYAVRPFWDARAPILLKAEKASDMVVLVPEIPDARAPEL